MQLKLEKYGAALKEAEEVVTLSKDQVKELLQGTDDTTRLVKFYFRRGQAYKGLGEFEKAYSDMKDVILSF